MVDGYGGETPATTSNPGPDAQGVACRRPDCVRNIFTRTSIAHRVASATGFSEMMSGGEES